MTLPRIAIDAMGGDEGVRVMVEGAALARRDHPEFQFLLVGDQARIERALDNHPGLAGAAEVLHSEDVISGDELPSKRHSPCQDDQHGSCRQRGERRRGWRCGKRGQHRRADGDEQTCPAHASRDRPPGIGCADADTRTA